VKTGAFAVIRMPSPSLAVAVKRITLVVLGWVAVSSALNLVWEIAQLPLYTIVRTEPFPRIAYAVLHCTIGDALIALGSFIAAGLATRHLYWPATHPLTGGGISTAFGLLYTAFSEWYNVYETGAWAYSESMPLVFGIGVAPLLQWLIIPLALLVFFRRRWRAQAAAPRFPAAAQG